MTLQERVKSYLGNGGLFNPEAMEHDKVRDLIMDLASTNAQLLDACRCAASQDPSWWQDIVHAAINKAVKETI